MRLLRDPLLHFLVLGAILFGLFDLLGKETQPPARIIVSAAQVAGLIDEFTRVWRRAPSDKEVTDLIESHVRDEVLYREGIALGFDRDDPIIRQRVQQKVELLADDKNLAEPDDEQLGSYLASHPDQFRGEDGLTFRHIFLSARRGQALASDVEQMAAKLANADGEVEGSETALQGDRSDLGNMVRAMPRKDLARLFGGAFADRVFALDDRVWCGPISSGFGQHFIFVEARTPSPPPLAAIRPVVRSEWLRAQRLAAQQKLYHTLRARYDIIIEAPSPGGAGEGHAGGVR